MWRNTWPFMSSCCSSWVRQRWRCGGWKRRSSRWSWCWRRADDQWKAPFVFRRQSSGDGAKTSRSWQHKTLTLRSLSRQLNNITASRVRCSWCHAVFKLDSLHDVTHAFCRVKQSPEFFQKISCVIIIVITPLAMALLSQSSAALCIKQVIKMEKTGPKMVKKTLLIVNKGLAGKEWARALLLIL